MSQFYIIAKRPLKSSSALDAMQAVPRIFLLEQTTDNMIYLWPIQRTITVSTPLDPNDPTDQELLRIGEYITHGGFYTSVADYFSSNNLPGNQFYVFYMGFFADVQGARSALQYLKALL